MRKWLKRQESETELLIPGSEVYLSTSGNSPVPNSSADSIPSAREATRVSDGDTGSPLPAVHEFPQTPPLYGLTLQASPGEGHAHQATPSSGPGLGDLAEGVLSNVAAAKALVSGTHSMCSTFMLDLHSKAESTRKRCFGQVQEPFHFVHAGAPDPEDCPAEQSAH